MPLFRRALNPSPGIFFALVSASLFGASTPFAKLLLGAVDPWMLAGLLYLGCGIGLGAARAAQSLTGLPAAEAPLRRADLPWLAGAVFTAGVIGPVLVRAGQHLCCRAQVRERY